MPALSERNFRAWPEAHRGDLSAGGVNAYVGIGTSWATNGRQTWISLTTPSVCGRVVRRGDGSSAWSAHTSAEGTELVSQEFDGVSAEQLGAFAELIESATVRPSASLVRGKRVVLPADPEVGC